MKRKLKKAVILIFIAFLLNDICSYIKAFIQIGKFEITQVGFFVSRVDIYDVYNSSLIYILFVMSVYFVTHYFKDETRDDYY